MSGPQRDHPTDPDALHAGNVNHVQLRDRGLTCTIAPLSPRLPSAATRMWFGPAVSSMPAYLDCGFVTRRIQGLRRSISGRPRQRRTLK
jgi:hypothetical protein